MNIENENLKEINKIDILLNNEDKDKIYEIILNYIENQIKIKPFYYRSKTDGSFNFSAKSMPNHSRAFLKIQDGCNNFCSFCTIPFARGRERSRNLEEIFNEINNLISDGFEEFILSGINLASYNFQKMNFNNLLAALTDKFINVRFRISSIEPQYINEEFGEIFKRDNICPHIHIPMQNASDKILKMMNRKYTAEEYYKKIEVVRSAKNHPFISTDLIIGFPGEDEKDFFENVDFIKKMKFSFIHLFGFSPRENTVAFGLKPKVPERIRGERMNELKQIVTGLNLEYRKKFISKKLEVFN